MSVESYMLVQIKKNDEWITAPLYNEERKYINFYFCGGGNAETIETMFCPFTGDEERRRFGTDIGAYDPFDEDDVQDIVRQDKFPMYKASLGYIKYMATRNGKTAFLFERIKYIVNVILELTQNDFLHLDDVRVVCFISR